MAAKMKLASVYGGMCERFDRVQRNWYSVMAAAACGILSITPTLCAPSMESIFDKLVSIIFDIAFYVGAIIVVIGIFNFVLAMKDENADGQSRGIKFCVVGIALVALETLVKPILNLF